MGLGAYRFTGLGGYTVRRLKGFGTLNSIVSLSLLGPCYLTSNRRSSGLVRHE